MSREGHEPNQILFFSSLQNFIPIQGILYEYVFLKTSMCISLVGYDLISMLRYYFLGIMFPVSPGEEHVLYLIMSFLSKMLN
jgi:hypothetical protein